MNLSTPIHCRTCTNHCTYVGSRVSHLDPLLDYQTSNHLQWTQIKISYYHTNGCWSNYTNLKGWNWKYNVTWYSKQKTYKWMWIWSNVHPQKYFSLKFPFQFHKWEHKNALALYPWLVSIFNGEPFWRDDATKMMLCDWLTNYYTTVRNCWPSVYPHI